MEIIILSLLIILIIISALILKSKNNVESLDENRELQKNIIQKEEKIKRLEEDVKIAEARLLSFEEVKAEMFEPDKTGAEVTEHMGFADHPESQTIMTPKGNVIRDTKYYLDMLAELVDALDDAISQKVKMTQYVDKLMKKKFKTYVRLKSDDKKE